jgi:hypothetical protein
MIITYTNPFCILQPASWSRSSTQRSLGETTDQAERTEPLLPARQAEETELPDMREELGCV